MAQHFILEIKKQNAKKKNIIYTFHKIWVSLISVTKWQETSINKFHEHILLIIFIIYCWFTYIFYKLIFIL